MATTAAASANETSVRKREVSVQKIVSNTINQAPFHPLGYVKVLAQIAHEPLPPFKSKTIFGNERFFYPNLFAYLKFIYSVEGVTGLYRGLGMKMLSTVVGGIAYEKVSIMFEECDETESKKGDESSFQLFIRHTSREITAKCWGVVFSHPFHVMALRCMAQFVGGETNYSSWNVFQNTTEIFKGEGVAGFFNGLVPRLLFEASTIALTSSLAYVIKTYVFDEKEIDAFVDAISSIFVSSLTYPLSLVSTVSGVSGSALIAGRPPRMIIYTSWVEAFKHLYENNELKRGSSYFFRIYNPSSSVNFKSGFVLNQPSPSLQNNQKRKYATA